MTFISRFFHFRIIRKFLISRASIHVVGHFRGLKIGALCISCDRQINVMTRIAAHAVRQLRVLTHQKPPHHFCMLFFDVLQFMTLAVSVKGKTSKKSVQKRCGGVWCV